MNSKSQELLQNLLAECEKVVIGKTDQIIVTISAILTGGHILIEDAPGMGKTTLAQTIAKLYGLEFNRVQFTSDLMPADILGFKYLDTKEQIFKFSKGPVFTNILLADEINRASPKSQSAFLQAMEEKEVSIEGENFELNKHFVVIATQNPEDQVGTHALPESQVDRFSVCFSMGDNSREIEKQILMQDGRSDLSETKAVLNNGHIDELKDEISKIEISEICLDLILDILAKVRESLGHHISIRSGHDLKSLSRVRAMIEGRNFVTPEDIFFFTPYVLGHRVSAGEDINLGINKIKSILSEVEAPIKE
jgi:MoxR-like ATPase